MVERVLTCKHCGGKYPPEMMRYFQDAKNLMCTECVRNIKNPKKESREERKSENNEEDSKKHRFKCQKCSHIFQIKEGFKEQCPYCSDIDLISQEWNSDLDALIDDSSKSIYDN